MTSRLIDSYLDGVEWRRTVRNWPEDIRTVVDGYRAYTTISHAVQKDAIQNGWSARKNKRGAGWGLTFELLEAAGKKFLIIMDSGTTGLTGKVLAPEEYDKDLPGYERWGRFEGVAFTQPRAERTLGSRGRGKFIFVGASKEYTILYDSLREDGSYRFGFRTVIRTESPVMAYDNEEGKKKLKEMTGNLIQPLSDVGTRVIVVEPHDEIINDVKSGNFLRFVGETWWEIIRDYQVAIKLKSDGKETIASIPQEFDLRGEDSKKVKVWIKRNQKIPTTLGEFRVKNLHLVYSSDGNIPEDIRGVAIQRDGMKIDVIEARYMGKEIAERVYGYINFDSDTEEALLEDEGIEHYSYDYRRALPGAIRRLIEDEILRFAQEKLGYGVDAREVKRQQQRNAERRALTAANSFARALGIGTGPGPRRKGHGGGGVPRKIRIQLEELSLPRPTDLRVNYGESVKNIKMRVLNENGRNVDMRVKFFLRYYDKVVRVFVEQDITLKANSVSGELGPFEVECKESEFPDSGKYTVVARIISLMDEDKGSELDYKTQSYYLEEDPPMRGLFERCEAFSFPDEKPIMFWMGYSEYGSERGLILYYNLNHPGYVPVSENEEDLAEYIIRIAGPEICRFDLIQATSVLFNTEQKDDPEELLKQERRVLGELIYKYRRGEV